MKNLLRNLLILLALPFLTTLCTVPDKISRAEFQDTYVLAFPTLQGGKIKLSNKNSSIDITPQIMGAEALFLLK